MMATKRFGLPELVLTLVSMLLCAYAVETVLHLRDRERAKRGSEALSSFTAARFDNRTRFEVVRDLRQTGVNAKPMLAPAGLIADADFCRKHGLLPPPGAFPGETTVYCNESGRFIVERADRFGFNNPDSVWDSPLDAVLVGDSLTQAVCVPQAESPAALLRAKGLNVASAAAGGNGPLLELATLVDYVLPKKPRRVFWMYFEGNDLVELPVEARDCPQLLHLLKPERGPLGAEATAASFAQARAEVERLEAAYAADFPARRVAYDRMLTSQAEDVASQARPAAPVGSAFRLNYIRSLLRGAFKTDDSARTAQAQDALAPLFREVMAAARDRTTAAGAEFAVVYIPSFDRIANRLSDAYRSKGEVLRVFADLRITVLDATGPVLALPDPLSVFPFRRQGHFLGSGNRILADLVRGRIENARR